MIRRVAQDFSFDAPVPGNKTPAPATTTPAGTTVVPAKPSGGATAPGTAPAAAVPASPRYPSSPEIKRMQAAIISAQGMLSEFMNTFTRKDLENENGGSFAKFVSPILQRMTPARKEFPFNTGRQDSSYPVGIIDRVKALANVGTKTPAGQSAPDGTWGPATTKGLLALTDVLFALSSLERTLGVEGENLTNKEIMDIYNLIPREGAKGVATNVNEKASAIADSIMNMRDNLGRLLGRIGSKEGDLVSGMNLVKDKFDAGYAKITNVNVKDVPGFLTHELTGLLQDPSGKTPTANIPMSALQDMDSFKRFIRDNTITVDGKDPLANPNDPSLINKYLDYIKSNVGKAIKIQPETTQGTR